jgi:hypothetical protein
MPSNVDLHKTAIVGYPSGMYCVEPNQFIGDIVVAQDHSLLCILGDKRMVS